MKHSPEKVSRRSLLARAAALAAAIGATSATPPIAAAPDAARRDPRLTADGQVKLNATLDGSPAFWTYRGIIYAVQPGVRPRPLLAVAGCQVNWAARRPDGSYLVAAPLLSFFRNVDTGAFLDDYPNPFTAERNVVRPNMFLHGRAIYPADGTAMRIAGSIDAAESAPQGFSTSDPQVPLGRVAWSLTHDSVVLDTDQFFDVRTQPQGEAQTRTASRAQFFDGRVTHLPARFSATTISPWLGWLQMGDIEGHLVWHTSGEKVFTVNEVDAEFRQHAGDSFDALTTKPAL